MKLLMIFCFFTLVMTAPAWAAKVFRYSEAGSPTTLDPVQSATRYSNLLVTALYDTLYEYRYLKVPYELKPSLAAAMPEVSKDRLTYTIRLKKGVRFIDDACFKGGKGREVVAEDFVYSIKRHFDPATRSQGAWLWRDRIVGLDDWKKNGADYNKPVAGLKVLDPHTVQIRLVRPYPQIIYTLAMGFSSVVPREAVEKYGREFSVHPVGSGPFRLAAGFRPQRAVLERNPGYRKEVFDLRAEGYVEKLHGFTGIGALDGKSLPIVDRVEVDFIKQSTARWNSFTKGNEIQFAGIPVEQVPRTLASKDPVRLKPELAKKYHIRPEPDFGLVYSGFNMAHEDFGYSKDPARNERNRGLRCAIRKAFNWPQRIRRFYNGLGRAFPGIVPEGVDGYGGLSRESVTLDVKGAKALLKKHGWNKRNLPVLEYPGVSSVLNKQFFEQFRGFLKKIGYPRNKVRYKTFATFGDYNRALKESRLNFFSLGWGMDYPDSENLMQLYYSPNASPGSNNSNYRNPEFDRLFEQAAVMLPGQERTDIYKKMNQILVDDCVTIAGFSRTNLLVWHKNAVIYPTHDVLGNFFKYADVM